MKKIFYVLVILSLVLSVVILSGCEDNTPASLTRDAQTWSSRANLALSNMEDQGFALSLRKEAELIGSSMDKDREVCINIFCLSEDNNLTYFPIAKNSRFTYINDSWHNIATSQVICNVAESEYNTTMHQENSSWKVVGAALTWTTHGVFNDTTWSVLDCDNDGYWDYISHDNLCSRVYAGSTSNPDHILVSYSEWNGICMDEGTEITEISSSDTSTLSQMEKLI